MSGARAKPPSELLFLPLGGAGEIGMNLNLFCLDGKWLMVDCGITFGDDATPGVDVMMPDPAFIVERRDNLIGLVLTHAHEDHIGAVPYLWRRLKCPIYATPFTAAVLRRKLADVKLEGQVPLHIVPLEGRFDVGPFNIELITLTHSILEPNALVIRTKLGTVLHTGDWKFDPTPLIGPPPDYAGLRRVGDEGVLALIGDSTNVFREGTSGSESEVRTSLTELVGRFRNRVAIASFASNLARLETIEAVAKAHDRQAALVGRSLWRMYEAARETGYMQKVRFLSAEDGAYLPRDRVLMAVTGSQGETNAALARIATGTHPDVVLEEGDAVIFSSRIIPGNEKAIGRLHDALIARGIEVVTENDHFVHVSGHPARGELVEMYQLVRPQVAIPVHGELRHMRAHAALAAECQVPATVVATNGQMVRLAPGTTEIVDNVPSGRLAVDGLELLPLDGSTFRERKRILWHGAVMATVVLDDAGELLADPKVSIHGLAEEGDDGPFIDLLIDAVEDAVEDMKPAQLRDDRAVQEAVRRALRRVAGAVKGKKPTTDVHVIRVD